MSACKRESAFFGPYSYLSDRCIGSSDATINKLLRERFHHAKNLFRRDLRAHFGCVNAIEFSHDGGEWICSGGDDRRVLLWNTEKATSGIQKPFCMKGEHHSNIFCLAFDHENKKVFSGGNDEQVIVHDLNTGESVDVFLHEEAVYGLSVDPVNPNVFASACDDGRVLIYDLRAPSNDDPLCLANYASSPMHAVMFNPVEPRLVATANSREGLGLWDARKPRSCVIRYGGSLAKQSCMSVRINRTGDKVIGLRRRLPPVLFNLQSPRTVHQFDHSGYYNSCTMKSCCFAGDKDQYVISGSDDFNLYVWRIPEEGCTDWVDKAHLILKGHRSIVNQVRFNPANHMIISSGVEKVVKVWSPFALYCGSGDLGLNDEESERSVYTHEEYINLVLRSGQLMTHDYTTENTEEDPRMMAFFDSLVQRELEGWSSDNSVDSCSPFDNSFIHSDNSRATTPDGVSDQIESVAMDTLLRFFSPFNALTNRSAWSAVSGTVVQNRQTSSTPNANDNAPQRAVDNSAQSNAGEEQDAVILDMDSHDVANNDGRNTDRGSCSTNSVMTMSISPSSEASQGNAAASVSLNTSDVHLPGQRVHSADEAEASTSQNESSNNINNSHQSVRSISQLILQKRTEYLAGIAKFHKRAEKRSQQVIERRREKIKRIRRRVSKRIANENESSMSDSDESVSSLNSSSDSTTSDTQSPGTGGQNVINEIITNRKQLLSRISKYKTLRKRVLKSGSSDNDSDNESHKKNSSPKICPPVYEDISSDSCHVETLPVPDHTSTSNIDQLTNGESKSDHLYSPKTTGLWNNSFSVTEPTSSSNINQLCTGESRNGLDSSINNISNGTDPSSMSNANHLTNGESTNGRLGSTNIQSVKTPAAVAVSVSSTEKISSLSNGHDSVSTSSNGELHLQTNGKHDNCSKISGGATNCDDESSMKLVDKVIPKNSVKSLDDQKASTSDTRMDKMGSNPNMQDDINEPRVFPSDSLFKNLKSKRKISRNYRNRDSDNME